jgi:hypothetical protein
MSERISILTPVLTDCPAVVVNTAVNSVDIPDAAAPKTLRGGIQTMFEFTNGDNIMLLSAGYFIPERFAIYEHGGAGLMVNPVMAVKFGAYRIVAGTRVTLNQFGNNGVLKLPFPNYEMSLGAAIDTASLIGENFSLEVDFPFGSGVDQVRLSMVGVPAAMNGITVHIVPFVKVLHNFELV